jgi:hypothetical protein
MRHVLFRRREEDAPATLPMDTSAVFRTRQSASCSIHMIYIYMSYMYTHHICIHMEYTCMYVCISLSVSVSVSLACKSGMSASNAELSPTSATRPIDAAAACACL